MQHQTMSFLPMLLGVSNGDASGEGFQFPNHWPMQADLLRWCHTMEPGMAVLVILGGIVYLLFGMYIFKILVTLNAAIMGAYLGAVVGETSGTAIPAAMV